MVVLSCWDRVGSKNGAGMNRAWRALLSLAVLATVVFPSTPSASAASVSIQTVPSPTVDIELTWNEDGYWLLGADGSVSGHGAATDHGDAVGMLGPGERAVSMSSRPGGGGYWIFTTLGRALQFGSAQHFGDMSGVPLNGPVLDSVATPSGLGYYMVASDGGVFTFGDAKFYGSMGGRHLNGPVNGLAPTADGEGYWLVADDGGIFSFGSAKFFGSMGGTPLNRPVVGMVGQGNGYLMVASDGGIFNFGQSRFHGSLGGNPPASPVVAVAPKRDLSGYRMVTATGAVHAFGSTSPAKVLPAPEGLVAAGHDRRVDLHWDNVDEAAGYIVYRSNSPDAGYAAINASPIGASSYTVTDLSNGELWWFRVAAVDDSGQSSPPSWPTSALPTSDDSLEPSTTELLEPGETTRVTAGEFSAEVPAGTVAAATAITVTPLPSVDGLLPSVDVHIHGTWDPTAGGVNVTMPFPFDESYSGVVIHETENGPTVTTGDALTYAGSGSQREVTVNARSLSVRTLAAEQCPAGMPAGLRELRLSCSTYRDQTPVEIFQRVSNQRWAQVQAAALAHQPCPHPSGEVALIGRLHTALTCTTDLSGDVASYHFNNNSDEGVAFWATPLVVTVEADNAAGTSISVNRDAVPWIHRFFGSVTNSDAIQPGATVTITKQRSTTETTLEWQTGRWNTFFATFGQLAAGQVGDTIRSHAGAGAQLEACLAANPSNTQRYVDCVLDVTEGVAQDQLTGVERVSSVNLLRLFSVPTMAAALTGTGDAIAGPTATNYLINSVPTQRPDTSRGEFWIARNPDNGRSVFVQGTQVRPIVDGATFNCLAESIVVWDVPTLAELRTTDDQGPATCSTAPLALWQFHPDGNVGTDVVLRTDSGQSWLIADDGRRRWIPDGGTYLCLAYSYPVIYGVPGGDVGRWPAGPSAVCGAEDSSRPFEVSIDECYDQALGSWPAGTFPLCPVRIRPTRFIEYATNPQNGLTGPTTAVRMVTRDPRTGAWRELGSPTFLFEGWNAEKWLRVGTTCFVAVYASGDVHPSSPTCVSMGGGSAWSSEINEGYTFGENWSTDSSADYLHSRIVRLPDGTSYKIEAVHSIWITNDDFLAAFRIPDGGTYQCLVSKGHPVIDVVDVSRFLHAAVPASCS